MSWLIPAMVSYECRMKGLFVFRLCAGRSLVDVALFDLELPSLQSKPHVHTRKAFKHIRVSSILIQAVCRGWCLRRQQKVALCLLSNMAARSIQTV